MGLALYLLYATLSALVSPRGPLPHCSHARAPCWLVPRRILCCWGRPARLGATAAAALRCLPRRNAEPGSYMPPCIRHATSHRARTASMTRGTLLYPGRSTCVRLPPHRALALPPLPRRGAVCIAVLLSGIGHAQHWPRPGCLPSPLLHCELTASQLCAGPRPRWLVGNLPEVLREGQETATERWCKEYGPGPFVYWLGALPIVTSDNPQFAKCIRGGAG